MEYWSKYNVLTQVVIAKRLIMRVKKVLQLFKHEARMIKNSVLTSK